MPELDFTPPIPPKTISLIGRRFFRLVVMAFAGRDPYRKRTLWLCRCDCGVLHIANAPDLKRGRVNSCGCWYFEVWADNQFSRTHYRSETPTYHVWTGMRRRCNGVDNPRFANYGGRGIRVCARWDDSFEAFASDMGERPEGMSLNRIDNDGNYSCGHCAQCVENGWAANCQWATATEQSRNRRSSRYLTANGETHVVTEWAELYGLDPRAIYRRLDWGWSAEEALGFVQRTIKRPRPSGRRSPELRPASPG